MCPAGAALLGLDRCDVVDTAYIPEVEHDRRLGEGVRCRGEDG